ncbi:MAG: hypothetical protein QGI60_05100, partial [archaeon]|nr:hypothetical protein [archaeon]
EFAGYAPIAPPKKGFNPFGRARRSYKAEQYRLFHSPAVQAALQDWKHAIETERTAQISIVNMHNRRPDEREIRNSMDRINEKKVAAIKAMEDLRKGFNKIRGKV